MKKKIGIAGSVCIVLILLLLLLSASTRVNAAGLVDDRIEVSNLYSRYPLDNYQLDFYVDNSWGWLPWNWGDGIGKSVQYGLYALTDFIWNVSTFLSNATGYLVQEAFKLDFISDTANQIGKNMQTLAGITPNGIESGFYAGFLMLMILVIGIYVVYTGLIKRETTKALQAVINFIVIFVLSASFIAYAPDYIAKINEFSADISNTALSVGTKITMPGTEEVRDGDSVDLIRDTLFSIQVQQPWLLLQYGTTDIDAIGADRVENLLSISPDDNKGEDREKAVKAEIEDKNNTNMTVPKVINRLGTAVFLIIFNVGISIFVFLLTGIMIFSQLLFIIFATFLPVSFLLAMLPGFSGMSRKAVVNLFNVIMMRAGITLIVTTAFSISAMIYGMSSDYPLFMVAFLQIAVYAGMYYKLGDILNMFNLQSNEVAGAKRIARKAHRAGRRMRRGPVGIAVGAIAGVSGRMKRSMGNIKEKRTGNERSERATENVKKRRENESEHQMPHQKSAENLKQRREKTTEQQKNFGKVRKPGENAEERRGRTAVRQTVSARNEKSAENIRKNRGELNSRQNISGKVRRPGENAKDRREKAVDRQRASGRNETIMENERGDHFNSIQGQKIAERVEKPIENAKEKRQKAAELQKIYGKNERSTASIKEERKDITNRQPTTNRNRNMRKDNTSEQKERSRSRQSGRGQGV